MVYSLSVACLLSLLVGGCAVISTLSSVDGLGLWAILLYWLLSFVSVVALVLLSLLVPAFVMLCSGAAFSPQRAHVAALLVALRSCLDLVGYRCAACLTACRLRGGHGLLWLGGLAVIALLAWQRAGCVVELSCSGWLRWLSLRCMLDIVSDELRSCLVLVGCVGCRCAARVAACRLRCGAVLLCVEAVLRSCHAIVGCLCRWGLGSLFMRIMAVGVYSSLSSLVGWFCV
ncbi:hypothetical protein OIU84_002881 [Salix udensis]|uniref:NADH dehydrogenase subunit 6 n=1 Tax=Salix udensis TaxID=889485 RepID=A0AAD6K6J9_9ROSI|nr:hypothetical protein OIU84_002881 [Salix udensis]